MGKPTVIIHHGDGDGVCAAAIIKWKLMQDAGLHKINSVEQKEIESKIPVTFVTADYDKPIPKIADRYVYITDFSPDAKTMERLVKNNRSVIWIDHHLTNFEKLKDFKDLPGIRRNGKSGCRLTWEHLFDGVREPLVCKYIGDYDIYAFEYGNPTRFLIESLNSKSWAYDPHSFKWLSLLFNYMANPALIKTYINRLLREGKVLYDAKLNRFRDLIKDYGYVKDFEGHKALWINDSGQPALGEIGYKEMGYPVVVAYVDKFVNGKMVRSYSLYSDGETVNVGELAKKHSGGGHSGAAGYSEDL